MAWIWLSWKMRFNAMKKIGILLTFLCLCWFTVGCGGGDTGTGGGDGGSGTVTPENGGDTGGETPATGTEPG